MTAHLTTKDLMAAFGVSHMTIYSWRAGSATKEPLPTVPAKHDPRAVLFAPAKVRAWAKKHGIQIPNASYLETSQDGATRLVKKPAKAPVKRAATSPSHRSHKAVKPPPRKAVTPKSAALA